MSTFLQIASISKQGTYIRRKIAGILQVYQEENHMYIFGTSGENLRYTTGLSNMHGKNRPARSGVVTSLLEDENLVQLIVAIT